MLDVALLGTGGMLPLPERWLSSVLVRYGSRLILFDCGEGTQITLRALGWGIKNVDLILISHLHGDHVGGLPGLLLSQGNSGRTEPVDILGPVGLTDAVRQLRVVAPYLPFEVRCRDLEGGEQTSLDELRISTAAADHAVPCIAYRLDLPRRPAFLPERAGDLGVPVARWNELANGSSVTVYGRNVLPEEVTGPPRRGISIGLVVDTRPTETLAQLMADVDLLVCEGTYASDEDLDKALERKHMTFSEAARFARDAGAHRLLLTHFSPSLVDPQAFAKVARAVFPNTEIGYDHLTTTLSYPKD